MLKQSLRLLHKTPLYTIYWQDEAHTICVMDVHASQWTWDQAFEAIQRMDQVVRSAVHPVYLIYRFEYGRNMLPRGGNVIANLRRLMTIQSPNTVLAIFVRADPAIRVFADFVMRTFQVLGHNFFYVTSMEHAQRLIEAHRSKAAANPHLNA